MLKRVLVLAMVMALFLSMGAAAQEMEFTLDGFGGIGMTTIGPGMEDADDLKTRDWSFLINAEAEVYPNIVVEGRYISSWARQVEDDDEFKAVGDVDWLDSASLNLVMAGAKYRLLEDNDLSAFLGAGYSMGTAKADLGNDSWSVDSKGFYGRAGIQMAVTPEITIRGDLSYAPFNTGDFSWVFDPEVNGADVSGSEAKGTIDSVLMTGRGSVTYQINEMLGVQVGVSYQSFSYKGDVTETYNGNGDNGNGDNGNGDNGNGDNGNGDNGNGDNGGENGLMSLNDGNGSVSVDDSVTSTIFGAGVVVRF